MHHPPRKAHTPIDTSLKRRLIRFVQLGTVWLSFLILTALLVAFYPQASSLDYRCLFWMVALVQLFITAVYIHHVLR
jgi:hypothetical protein